MFQLTLQLYSDGQWLDAMILKFPEPEKSLDGPCLTCFALKVCRK